MIYNYKNKEYIIEYAVVGVEDLIVWASKSNRIMSDFFITLKLFLRMFKMNSIQL